MNNELREAAERLRKANDLYLDSILYSEDLELLADAWLLEHQHDDNEPVDNTWLRSILIQGGEFQYHDSMPDFLNLYNDDFDVDIESMKSKPITRGQVRLLLRALQ